jgi:exopolysaccharide production protein ExoQ
MPTQAYLLAFVAFICWMLVTDLRRREGVSSATWLVLLWIVIFSSRPVSTWLQSGSMTMMGANSAESYLEGSPVDRLVFLGLELAGVLVLVQRGLPWGQVISRNGWLFAFYFFWLASILWSEIPFAAFKRLFKDFGTVVMALVLLTEKDPVEAVRAVFVRCAYLLIPVSVLFIRYYPELGRAYTGYSMNDLMYVGVATHKNTLGALLLGCGVFLVWELMRRKRDGTPAPARLEKLEIGVVVLMLFWLLRVANSATALACTFLSIAIFLATEVGIVRRSLRYVEVIVLVLGGLWFALDSMLGITEMVVLSLGRDMTLTTRTVAWDMVLQMDLNPLLGAGFKSFWAGERMIRIWRQFPGIVQAHNGYIEVYLQGGLVALFLLTGMMWSGFRKIKRQVVAGDDFARVRLTFWLIVLIYNFSEAAFTHLSMLWIVTLLVITDWPAIAPTQAPVAVAPPEFRRRFAAPTRQPGDVQARPSGPAPMRPQPAAGRPTGGFVRGSRQK